MRTPEKSTRLINHALAVAKEWFEQTGEHLNPVIHYYDGENPSASVIVVTEEDRLQGVVAVNCRVAVTLKRLIFTGVDEFTVSYEGHYAKIGRRVLVVSYISREKEMTWSADLTSSGEVLEWQMISPVEGALVDLYKKAEIHLWN